MPTDEMSSSMDAPSSPPRTSQAFTSPSFVSPYYFTFPITHTVNGILRRLSIDPMVYTPRFRQASLQETPSGLDGVYTPPGRYASPFQPPPLYPLSLKGWADTTPPSARLLSRALAEEIRLLVPPRLQLVEDWKLVYSLDQHGSSLRTLYKRCSRHEEKRGGFVLVVRDGNGAIFGAFLTDPPHPSSHYYGTGECFLWRALILSSIPTLSSLPPPPSADTTHLQRMTTLGQPKQRHNLHRGTHVLTPPNDRLSPAPSAISGTSTPERIRFKAFPYAGINDYMMFCEHGYLSVGGGDGRYGLWLDASLETGVSEACPTFGNEGLSDQGKRFEVLGVELWFVGV